MQTFLEDLRHALRALRKAPGFTAAALLTLTLGTGANTALFSIVNGVLLTPLPFPEPDRLVALHQSKPNFDRGSISYLNFRDWQQQSGAFSSMAIARSSSFTLTGVGTAEQVTGTFISADYFSLLGIQPLLGRALASGEDERGAPPLVLISAGFWQRKFGSSPEVIGRTITLDGAPRTVIGVVPAFQLGASSPGNRPEVFVPIGQWTNNLLLDRGAGLGIHGLARLKAGVTLTQARADLDQVTRGLAEVYPSIDRGVGAAIVPLADELVGRVRPYLLLLFGAVVFVLLIACVNVANLLLARSSGRAREFAIRSALGAGRGRIVRQLLTESIVLGLLGGILGVALAAWITPVVVDLVADVLPRTSSVRLDGHVLGFTLLVSLLTGVLFGLAPALASTGRRPMEALRESLGSRGSRHRSQGAFVVVEVALALVLLIGAGLMIRTLVGLLRVDTGFDPDRLLVFGLSLPPGMSQSSPEAIRAAFRDVHTTIASVPGVRGVSFTAGAVPLSGDDEQLFWIDGEPRPMSQDQMRWTLSYIVEPDYLRVLGLRLMRGRFIGPEDSERAVPVGVVDEVFARTFFPDDEAIGKRINLERGAGPVEIVGVVGHVKQWGLDTDDRSSVRAQLYLPFAQAPDGLTRLVATGIGVMVRTEPEPLSILEPIRRASERMSSQQAVFGAQSMREIISDSLARQRFAMILFSFFGGLSLFLATIGIYGVVSYVIGQRTGEIGLRMALGAQRGDILRLVLRGGGRLAMVGIVLGLTSALGLTRLMEGFLFQVRTVDPPTFVGAAVVLLLVALGGCLVPARRACRVDPMVALGQD